MTGHLRLRARYGILLSALLVLAALLVSVVHLIDSWRIENAMRSRRLSAEKPAKTTECTAPRRAQASMA